MSASCCDKPKTALRVLICPAPMSAKGQRGADLGLEGKLKSSAGLTGDLEQRKPER